MLFFNSGQLRKQNTGKTVDRGKQKICFQHQIKDSFKNKFNLIHFLNSYLRQILQFNNSTKNEHSNITFYSSTKNALVKIFNN